MSNTTPNVNGLPEPSAVLAIANLAKSDAVSKLVLPELVEGDGYVPLLISNDGTGTKVVDASHLLETPRHFVRQQRVVDPSSFIAYVNRFKLGGSTIFASEALSLISCALDYPAGPGDTSALRHSVTLELATPAATSAWLTILGDSFSQEQLAEFLNEHDFEIIEPDAATVREAVLKLLVTKDYRIESRIDPTSGSVSLNYVDELKQVEGAFKLPTSIFTQLSIYQGMPSMPVEAHLRYRANGSKVSFTLHMPSLEKLRRECFAQVCDAISLGTGIDPLFTP